MNEQKSQENLRDIKRFVCILPPHNLSFAARIYRNEEGEAKK